MPLFADECISRQLRISFARILTEIDVTKELPEYVLFEDYNSTTIKQAVTYDWIPPNCNSCQKVGHDCALKKNYPPTTEEAS